jgi:hypothetical protein
MTRDKKFFLSRNRLSISTANDAATAVSKKGTKPMNKQLEVLKYAEQKRFSRHLESKLSDETNWKVNWLLKKCFDTKWAVNSAVSNFDLLGEWIALKTLDALKDEINELVNDVYAHDANKTQAVEQTIEFFINNCAKTDFSN